MTILISEVSVTGTVTGEAISSGQPVVSTGPSTGGDVPMAVEGPVPVAQEPAAAAAESIWAAFDDAGNLVYSGVGLENTLREAREKGIADPIVVKLEVAHP